MVTLHASNRADKEPLSLGFFDLKREVSYIFPNGDKYEGECSRSASGGVVRCGTGTHTSVNGIIYSGEWSEDRMQGKGCLQHPSGAVYEGEFKDNMYHGSGKYTFPDGSACKGQFVKNRLKGDGAFTNTQGLDWTGKFHNKAALGLRMQHSIPDINEYLQSPK